MLSTAEAVCQKCSFHPWVCEVSLFRWQNEIVLSVCCKCGGIIVCLPEIDMMHLLNKIWQGKHMHHQPLQSNFIHSCNLSFDMYDSFEFTFDFVMLFSTLPLPSSSSSSSVRSQSPVSISLPCRPLAVDFPHQNWIFSQIFPVKGEFILGSGSWFSKVFSDNHWCYFKKKNKQTKTPQINN